MGPLDPAVRASATPTLLRAAIVFLHATLEDVLRAVLESRWPSATDPELFRRVPFVLFGDDRRPEKLAVADLARHLRGRTIDSVVSEAVQGYLEHSSFNDVDDVVTVIITRDRSRSLRSASGEHASRPCAMRSLPSSDGGAMIEAEMPLTEERLRDILAAIPGVEQVTVYEDRGRLLARVIASRWEGVDEADRQAEVYDVLLATLQHRHERRRVEFIFTDTPREYAEAAASEA